MTRSAPRVRGIQFLPVFGSDVLVELVDRKFDRLELELCVGADFNQALVGMQQNQVTTAF
jgi:hypothetical protein